ncbi:uncharacterized protein LOC131010897 [Salvia miltiorrhiza]|uniref:uncharacterized protein LOC131010897 n=1 Tax=Salvia miltiorrhiza TaxID=226208 RepID=UPI0025ACD294|nr:uncharacterized protein LOC131010897 [Salvia miltiorrhiza]
MDSGNSGSMQSSSGGDDQEFDSSSSFLNPPHHFGSISAAAAAAAPQFLSHQNPNFFDPNPSQNLDHGGGYANDSDLIWSRGLRSDNHAFSNLGNSPLPSRPQQIPAAPPPQQQASAARNPKKRTRASRRAPTTVLTTDTTNFRQMVQEFTGIPAAPFSGSSPYSRRLDLFSAASALRSAAHLDGLGPLYPLRPAAHKIMSPFSSSSAVPPPLLNSTMIDAIVPTTTITNTNSASTSNIDPNNFQLYQHGINNQQMNFSNLSGFLSRDGGASAAAQLRGDDDLSRWKSGETVRNNDDLAEFDGNNKNINSGESHNYNLNVAEKGMENAAASSTAEGTVASWICPSD